MNVKDVPVVILAGGRGTRMMEETQVIPKPMVTIGGMPILLHLMRYYGSFGFRNFIICLGYKGYVIKDYFLNLPKHTADLTIDGAAGQPVYRRNDMSQWRVSLVETGELSLTAKRLVLVKDYIKTPVFCLTYGDGLSDLDLMAEMKFHVKHRCLATVAAVHPPSRFGRLELGARDIVDAFQEKIPLLHDYINGGYFVFRREFLATLNPVRNESLEADPLSRLARDGDLKAFRHEGFWSCMDTLRDRDALEETFSRGSAPWVRW